MFLLCIYELNCAIYVYCLCDSDEPIMQRLKEMGPSAIDSELRSLAPDCGGSIEVMCNFVQFIDNALQTNRDFELAQAYLALFLKVCIILN